MTLRQPETDTNFVDIQPDALERAAAAMRNELEDNRRAWEKTLWTLEYVRKTYPEDVKLNDALEAIRHHLERRF